MLRWIVAALLFAAPAYAQNNGYEILNGVVQGGGVTPQTLGTTPFTATGGTSARTAAAMANDQGLNVLAFGAKANALTFSDGVVTTGTNSFCSNSATFSSADVGKIIQIDGAAGTTSAPLNTTIASYVSTHCVTLTANATATTPLSYFAGGNVATGGATGSYIPGETVSITGGTSSTQAVATIQDTLVHSATVNAGGSGGTNGTCVVQGTTGSGTLFQVSVTISGAAITAIGSFVNAGHYFANPTSLTAEPVTNAPGYACAPAGATLTLIMWAETVNVATAGSYSATPSSPAATGAGSSSGATGLTLTPTWNATGYYVYGSDDSAAFVSAINHAATNFSAGGYPNYVYAPAGIYLIDVNTLPTMGSGLGITGAGVGKTNFFIGASYSGDLFSWSEAWLQGVGEYNGSMYLVNSNRYGARASAFSVWGNRRASAQQNAMVFYDRDDEIYLNDIDVFNINGRCLYSGVEKNQTQAYVRESRFGKLRCFNTGATGAPSVEFNSQGTSIADATNEIEIGEFDIFGSYGTSFIIRNANAGTAVRNFRINKVRVEGLGGNAAATAADLVVIGDPTLTGNVNSISFDQLETVDPYAGYAALRVTAASGASQPFFITFHTANIAGGLPLGYGIKVDAGRGLYFHVNQLGSWNTQFSVASSSTVGNQIVVDGDGSEQFWTWNIDPSVVQYVSTPLRKVNNPSKAAAAIISGIPDSTVLGGNGRGTAAVDLQTARTAASQVASGTNTVLSGGAENTNAGNSSTISGGFVNSSNGSYTAITGGRDIYDRGLNGGQFYASNCQSFFIQGACQRGWHTLGKSTGAALGVRLTSDQGSPNTVNCINIPTNTVYKVGIEVSVADRTTSTNVAGWNRIQGLLYRGAGNAAYAGGDTSATTPDESAGSLSTATITVAADTSNQCLSLTFTPPSGNTDTLDVTATVDTAEVQ